MRGGGGGGVDRPVRALHHNHRGAELWIEELLTLATSNFPLEHSLQSSGAQRRKVVQHPTWAQEPCQKSCNFKLAELSCCLSETNKSLQKLNTILPAYCRYPPSSVPPLPISAAMQSKFHPRYKAVNDISQNTVSPIGNT